jgi:hypothetical protein
MIEVTPQDAAEKAKAVKAGELPGPAKSLAEAMHRVMTQVGYVQKKGTMQGAGSYKFAGEAQFIEAIRPELVAQQIVVCPVGMEPLVSEVFTSSGGKPQNRIVLRVTFRFTHAASGQSLDVVTCGEGVDQGDKATNKAMTGAMKYALRQAFVIETGNDPDDTPSHTQERAPVQQAQPVRDNLQLRGKFVSDFAQCKDMTGFRALGLMVKGDADAGKLSPADLAAIRDAAGATQDRLAGAPA